MELSVLSPRADADAARCSACGTTVAAPVVSHHALRGTRSYRGAWFVLGCVFVFGLLWANRYDYQVCDVDGCVRINRWTSQVDWIGSEAPPEADSPYNASHVRSTSGPRTGAARPARASIATRH